MKTAIKICQTAILFWALETLFFAVNYGWHYAPVNKSELTCDRISGCLFGAGIIWFILAFMNKMQKKIEPEYEQEECLHQERENNVCSDCGKLMD